MCLAFLLINIIIEAFFNFNHIMLYASKKFPTFFMVFLIFFTLTNFSSVFQGFAIYLQQTVYSSFHDAGIYDNFIR